MSVGMLFDGTDDRIESSTGADFSSMAGYTCLYICHPDTMAGFDTVFSMMNGGTSGLTFGWSGTAPYIEHDTGVNRTAAVQSYSGWYCVIWTKPTGTAQTRSHIFNGQAWAHANVGATAANPVAALSSLELARYDAGASDLFDGDVAVVGIWSEDTTDGNCEALLDYDSITAKSNRQFLTGTSLLNGGTMADSGAGNSETARTGATTGVRHIPGWFLDFDDDGFANASQWNAGGVATGTLVLTPPLGTVSGDLLIAAGTVDTGSTLSNSTGWTEIRNTANGSACRHVVWGRIADGGANDTLTMTQGTAGSDISGVVVRVTDHGVTTVSTDVFSGTPATNTSATPNPPTLTPSPGSDDYLWIVTFGADDDDDQANWTPPDFSGIRQIQSASSTTSTLTGMAFRKFTGTTLDPGVFNMAASEEWVSNTLAIPPASGMQESTGGALAQSGLSARAGGAKTALGGARAMLAVTARGAGTKAAPTGGAWADLGIVTRGAGRKAVTTGGALADLGLAARAGARKNVTTGGALADLGITVRAGTARTSLGGARSMLGLLSGAAGTKSTTGGASAPAGLTGQAGGAKAAVGGAQASLGLFATVGAAVVQNLTGAAQAVLGLVARVGGGKHATGGAAAFVGLSAQAGAAKVAVGGAQAQAALTARAGGAKTAVGGSRSMLGLVARAGATEVVEAFTGGAQATLALIARVGGGKHTRGGASAVLGLRTAAAGRKVGTGVATARLGLTAATGARKAAVGGARPSAGIWARSGGAKVVQAGARAVLGLWARVTGAVVPTTNPEQPVVFGRAGRVRLGRPGRIIFDRAERVPLARPNRNILDRPQRIRGAS